MSGATKNAMNSAASGSRRGIGDGVISGRRAALGGRARRSCARPCKEQAGDRITERVPIFYTCRLWSPAGAAALPCAQQEPLTLVNRRNFGEYAFLEDSRDASQWEIEHVCLRLKRASSAGSVGSLSPSGRGSRPS